MKQIVSKMAFLSLLASFFPVCGYSQIIDEKTLAEIYKYSENRSYGRAPTDLPSVIKDSETLRNNTSWLLEQVSATEPFLIQREYHGKETDAFLSLNPIHPWDTSSIADSAAVENSNGRHFVVARSDTAFVLLSAYSPYGYSPFDEFMEPKSDRANEFPVTGKITVSVAYRLPHLERLPDLVRADLEMFFETLGNASHAEIEAHTTKQLMRYNMDKDIFSAIGKNARFFFSIANRDYLAEHRATLERLSLSSDALMYMQRGSEARLGFFKAKGNGEQYLILTSEVSPSFTTNDFNLTVSGLSKLIRELVSDTYRSYLKVKSDAPPSSGGSCTPFPKLFN
ncbi:MAG: hypothetical protein KDD37_03845 [Bdellovibrionales bacterium]|nr:hypothetical protein [Bdellovibrionales bacterium]